MVKRNNSIEIQERGREAKEEYRKRNRQRKRERRETLYRVTNGVSLAVTETTCLKDTSLKYAILLGQVQIYL